MVWSRGTAVCVIIIVYLNGVCWYTACYSLHCSFFTCSPYVAPYELRSLATRRLRVRPERHRAQSCTIALRSPASERSSDLNGYSPDMFTPVAGWLGSASRCATRPAAPKAAAARSARRSARRPRRPTRPMWSARWCSPRASEYLVTIGPGRRTAQKRVTGERWRSLVLASRSTSSSLKPKTSATATP